jgi:flagellar L-ring protein precursor FlgH
MTTRRFRILQPLLAWPVMLWATAAIAQDGGLLHPDGTAETPRGLTLEECSLLYQPAPPPVDTELRLNDIITVLVDVRARMLSEGDVENRKTAFLNAVLTDWIKFDGKSIMRAPQNNGDPAITGTLRSQYRAESDMEARESLTFQIAAKIVDIRPNGNLVIEAHQTIQNNEEVWQQSLTGIVRRESIGPDRTVKSENIAELRIDKHEVGHVRDGYQRGWFTYLYDKLKPF